MLYISYGSVCELETQVMLAGDLDFIVKADRDMLMSDIREVERMLKALINALERKTLEPLTPGILESSAPRTLSSIGLTLHTIDSSRIALNT